MIKDINYFMSMGMDEKTAAYFANGRRKILSVEPCENRAIVMLFDNGEKRLLDLRDIIKIGTVFEPLLNQERFESVYLDDCHCVSWDIDPDVDSNEVWNNKLDLCPDTCYIDSVPV